MPIQVGKKVEVAESPIGAIIYATNMVPKVIQLPIWMPIEEREALIEKAKEDYELARKRHAERFGELDA